MHEELTSARQRPDIRHQRLRQQHLGQQHTDRDDSGTGAPPADTLGTATDSAADPAADRPAKKTAKKATKAPAKKAAAKKTTKKAAKSAVPDPEAPGEAAEKPKKKTGTKKKAAAKPETASEAVADAASPDQAAADQPGADQSDASAPAAPMVLFKAPEPPAAPEEGGEEDDQQAGRRELGEVRLRALRRRCDRGFRRRGPAPGKGRSGQGGNRGKGGQGSKGGKGGKGRQDSGSSDDEDTSTGADTDDQGDSDDDGTDGEGGARRRRRRGGRRRRKPDGNGDDHDNGDDDAPMTPTTTTTPTATARVAAPAAAGAAVAQATGTATPTTQQHRHPGPQAAQPGGRDHQHQGSTRLEAKKQRRREGREAGRRRAPIVSEAEFLARRESVDRVMVIRQHDDLTQIGVLEDKVLVEHYVARESQTSLIGNVYLGRVQNVLPSMEAAFIDIGKGRNAVLYAGEVNWNALGAKDGQPRKIESVLKSGQPILVQVTKDPVGHKGARLTSQVSLPGRFLVYVPDGTTSGISRKLPDTERNRLKTLLKEIVPDTAGVIVRTAAEGASEDELTLDVERLTARWSDIDEKVKAGNAPQLLYGEPDLTLKVVRDLFTEDFTRLVIQGDDAWDLVDGYVSHVAPDLRERLERYGPGTRTAATCSRRYRVDEQIAKGLDRKVWLPSGGSLIIDRTEAMTVVDVNTGKFTGSGGNLEETVTKNNLEAAEEIVRQLRLRDIGGIIVIDFIDMVLESNRDLVLRRMVECLGRDRTRHQVAEVTSLGLVQMTRKRIGTGLLEAFSQDCDHCKGRGLLVHDHPIEPSTKLDDDARRGGRRGRSGGSGGGGGRLAAASSGNGNGGNGGGNGANNAGRPGHSRPRHPATSPQAREHAEKHPADEPDQDSGRPSHETPGDLRETTPEDTEQPLATDTVAEPEPPPEPEPVPRRARPSQRRGRAGAGAQPAPEPDAPELVTSTRRRTARRPAGPPSRSAARQPRRASSGAPAARRLPSSPERATRPTAARPVAEPDPRAARSRDRDPRRPTGPSEHPGRGPRGRKRRPRRGRTSTAPRAPRADQAQGIAQAVTRLGPF